MITKSLSRSGRSLLLLLLGTLWLSLTAFECASTEMTTAKVAMNARDYKKAEDALKREVAARPQNSEAWLLLAQIYEMSERSVDMSQAFERAEAGQPPLTNEQREAIVVKRYNQWGLVYNRADMARQNKDYQVALKLIDTAIMLRKSAAENYYLQGLIFLGKGDTAKQTKLLEEYTRMLRPDVDKGLSAGLALGMSPADVAGKLGKAGEGEVSDTASGWQYFPDKGLCVYYVVGENGGGPMVMGWKTISSSDPAVERRISSAIRSEAFYTLGVDAYYAGETNKARYDDALGYFRLVERLDPSYKDIGKVIAQIYISTGRTAEARKRYEDEIKARPSDPHLRINYGNFLSNMEDFPAAIPQYDQAVKLSAGNEELKEQHNQAIFNLGAAYKNWAVHLQDSVRKAAGTKPPSKAQEEVYMVKLRESQKQFEELRRLKGASVDFSLLFELANLYQVLRDEPKMKGVLKALEEMAGSEGDKSSYWDAMDRLYANIGDGEKAEAAHRKADALRAQGK